MVLSGPNTRVAVTVLRFVLSVIFRSPVTSAPGMVKVPVLEMVAVFCSVLLPTVYFTA